MKGMDEHAFSFADLEVVDLAADHLRRLVAVRPLIQSQSVRRRHPGDSVV